MTTKIFLPLRSNTGWFSEDEGIRRFERLLKIHIALFDRIVLEDGTYEILADSDGQGFTNTLPPEGCKGFNRNEFHFYQQGGDFGVSIGDRPVLQGKLSLGCSADFRPVLARAGLEEATYFEWFFGDLVDELKPRLDELAESDLRDKVLIKDLPSQAFFRTQLVKSFYRDGMIAKIKKLPLAVDHHLARFLDHKRARNPACLPAETAFFVYDHWVNLNLPDFASYSWQEIHELHESDAGNDFRRMIERTTGQVNSAIRERASPMDVDHLVATIFSQELVHEVVSRRNSVAGTSVKLLLNIVPYGSLISGASDLTSMGRDVASWISLLR
jgi:hypothetical protein